jgi:hypothetical protein
MRHAPSLYFFDNSTVGSKSPHLKSFSHSLFQHENGQAAGRYREVQGEVQEKSNSKQKHTLITGHSPAAAAATHLLSVARRDGADGEARARSDPPA